MGQPRGEQGLGGPAGLSATTATAATTATTAAAPPPPTTPIVEIPGFTHPVQQFFLEDAVEWTGLDLREVALQNASASAASGRGGGGGYARKRLRRLEKGYDERLQGLMMGDGVGGGVNGWMDVCGGLGIGDLGDCSPD